MKYLLIGLLIISVIVFFPLLLIWALNALFTLGMPYTLKTWAASFIIGIYFASVKGNS